MKQQPELGEQLRQDIMELRALRAAYSIAQTEDERQQVLDAFVDAHQDEWNALHKRLWPDLWPGWKR